MKLRYLLLAGLSLSSAGLVRAWQGPDRFDHRRHATLFPSCVSCHQGSVDSGAALLPSPTACTGCHDGTTERRVEWAPREGPRPSNLRFVHATHPKVTACVGCHGDEGAGRMTVHPAVPGTCFACHGERREHLAQADSTCGTCHLPLRSVPATLLALEVAGFPAPPSHRVQGFGAEGGHATPARNGDQSCATCHAKEFCAECHATGAAVPSIDALGSDPRATAIPVIARTPASHARSDFERAHAGLARRRIEGCATCHTQATCTSCHVTLPAPATRLTTTPIAVARHDPPASHRDPRWASAHGPLASARPQNCVTCHARSECLDCHRPDPARGAGNGYHPAGFLASHPAAAYGRTTSCADCHNTQGFCQDCHRQAGVTASARLRGGFHDANPTFLLGHGPAARQSLESCVTCHAERDCLTCHSATRGRGFDPHGPGFDGERLKRKNPGLCAACHAPGSV